ALQLSLHLENDIGAALGRKRRVTHELDGIAKSLLSVQEDGLAGNRLLAEPQGCAKIADFHPWVLPTAFVFLPTALEFAMQQSRDRAVPTRLDEFRVEFDRD